MAKGKNQHIVPHPEGWAIKSAGAERATKVLDSIRSDQCWPRNCPESGV
jgi:hypothetical protein